MTSTTDIADRSATVNGHATSNGGGYDAQAIVVLEGLQAVRKRPGMYIGGVGSEGLQRLLWEAIDNAADEAAEGHGQRIEVALNADGSYTVADEGRGVPVGAHSTGVSALEVVFTELHAGGKFGTGSYSASGGLHGVGAAVITALSTRMTVTSRRHGHEWRLDFSDQRPGLRDGDGTFTPGHDLRCSPLDDSTQTGTTVTFTPDLAILGEDSRVSFRAVKNRLTGLSGLLPGVTLTATDRRDGDRCWETVGEGLPGLVDSLSGGSKRRLSHVIEFAGRDTFVENIPAAGEMIEVIRDCRVHVALAWTQRPGRIVSYANTVPTSSGGMHVSGFERALVGEINRELAARNPLKLRKLADGKAIREDCTKGLVAAIAVRVPEPQFGSQTKQQLTTPQIRPIVNRTVRDGVKAWLTGQHVRSRKTHVNRVLGGVVQSVVNRNIAAEQAATAVASARLTKSPIPVKLSDCRTHPDGELLIVEGDSAAGPAKRVRDSDWQAIIPIRGKIINASKCSAAQFLANREVQALITTIGVGTGAACDPGRSRYQRIVLLADADVDGLHIRCLLLTLFWHHMRPILTEGMVFAAMPPTHALTAKSGDGKLFAWSDQEMRDLVDDHPGWRVTRFKGLGEMDDSELLETCLNPETRALRQITVPDAAQASKLFATLMGRPPGPRREYIVEHSARYGGRVAA